MKGGILAHRSGPAQPQGSHRPLPAGASAVTRRAPLGASSNRQEGRQTGCPSTTLCCRGCCSASCHGCKSGGTTSARSGCTPHSPLPPRQLPVLTLYQLQALVVVYGGFVLLSGGVDVYRQAADRARICGSARCVGRPPSTADRPTLAENLLASPRSIPPAPLSTSPSRSNTCGRIFQTCNTLWADSRLGAIGNGNKRPLCAAIGTHSPLLLLSRTLATQLPRKPLPHSPSASTNMALLSRTLLLLAALLLLGAPTVRAGFSGDGGEGDATAYSGERAAALLARRRLAPAAGALRK